MTVTVPVDSSHYSCVGVCEVYQASKPQPSLLYWLPDTFWNAFLVLVFLREKCMRKSEEGGKKSERKKKERCLLCCEVGRLPSLHVFILTHTLCQGLIPILWPFINAWNMRCPTLHFPPLGQCSLFLVHTMRSIFQACTLSAQCC